MDVFSARKVIKEALLHTYGTVYEYDVCFVLKYCFGLSSCWAASTDIGDIWVQKVARDIRQGIPIQYICGIEEFKGKPFLVFPGVFIPREETEDLVDIAIDVMPRGSRILEIGVGTGVISISLLMSRRDIIAMGVDINPLAVINTFTNARRFEVDSRLQLYHADVFSLIEMPMSFDFVLSNPPYLPDSDRLTIDELVSKEPESALYGGFTGVEFIHKVIDILIKTGFHGGLLFEFDDTTQHYLRSHEKMSVSRVKYYKDRFGKERFALVWL